MVHHLAPHSFRTATVLPATHRTVTRRGRPRGSRVALAIAPALGAGDLVARSRDPAVDYDNAVGTGWFIGHSDIVVAVDRTDRVAHMIGGNVGHSVSRLDVPLTPNGMLADPDRWLAHIRLNI